MRGMHRFLAAILLAGAVGGVAVFARHLGRVPEPVAARLAAPPPQHFTAPDAVRAPVLVPVRPAAVFGVMHAAKRVVAPPLLLSPSQPLHIGGPVATPAPAPKPATPPKPSKPAPAVTAPVAAPAPAPQPPARVLATVPLTPVPATPAVAVQGISSDNDSSPPGHGHGHGHAYGHAKHDAAQPATVTAVQTPASVPATPEPLTPVTQPSSAIVLTPVDSGSDESTGDDSDQSHGHGWGRGNGKRHRD